MKPWAFTLPAVAAAAIGAGVSLYYLTGDAIPQRMPVCVLVHSVAAILCAFFTTASLRPSKDSSSIDARRSLCAAHDVGDPLADWRRTHRLWHWVSSFEPLPKNRREIHQGGWKLWNHAPFGAAFHSWSRSPACCEHEMSRPVAVLRRGSERAAPAGRSRWHTCSIV